MLGELDALDKALSGTELVTASSNSTTPRCTIGGRIRAADVSFAIEAGEFIGVLGPNGAGKTTLMRAILGLLPPSAGSVQRLRPRAERGDPGDRLSAAAAHRAARPARARARFHRQFAERRTLGPALARRQRPRHDRGNARRRRRARPRRQAAVRDVRRRAAAAAAGAGADRRPEAAAARRAADQPRRAPPGSRHRCRAARSAASARSPCCSARTNSTSCSAPSTACSISATARPCSAPSTKS